MKTFAKGLVLSVLVFSLQVSSVFADTVYLKSGKIIRGEITEKTDKTVTIETEAEWFTFDLKDIENIIISGTALRKRR